MSRDFRVVGVGVHHTEEDVELSIVAMIGGEPRVATATMTGHEHPTWQWDYAFEQCLRQLDRLLFTKGPVGP